MPFLMGDSRSNSLDAAQAFLDEGKSDKALKILIEAIEKSPDDARLLLYSGLANVEAGNGPAGVNQIERAVKLDPSNAMMQFFLARALYDCAEYAAAKQACSAVEKVQPGHPGSAALRSLCVSHEDPIQGFLELSLSSMPDDSNVLGRALLRAEVLLAEVPARLPAWSASKKPWELGAPDSKKDAASVRSAKHWAKKSRFAHSGGSPDRAIIYAEAAMRTRADDETRVLLATLYFEIGRYAETEAALEGFMLDDPERNSYVGISRFQRGDIKGAIASLEKGDPAMARGVHTLGRSHLAAGSVPAARFHFVRTARVDEALAVSRIARAFLTVRGKMGMPSGEEAARPRRA